MTRLLCVNEQKLSMPERRQLSLTQDVTDHEERCRGLGSYNWLWRVLLLGREAQLARCLR